MHGREQSLLAAIVESSDDAIVSKTLEGVVTSWNTAAERIFGYAAAEMIGRPITTIFPADRLHEEEDFLRRISRGERIDHYETVRIRKDGRPIDVSVTLSPLRGEGDATGVIVGVSKIARDITERKRAEARLHEQSESWRVTLSSIGDAVIATDGKGQVTFMNRVAESLTGWRLDDARSRPLEDVFHVVNEHTRQPAENPVSRVLEEGVTASLANDTVLLSRDGRERPIDDSAAPMHDAHGRIAGVVLVFRDVTERRRAEVERTELLAAEQAARAEAERANHVKDEFLARLSHELRTPLNGIFGWTRMLRDGTLDADRTQRALQAIERNLELQMRLIEDLLDVSRIVSGTLRLDIQKLDLAEVIETALDVVRASAEARGVLLESVIDPAARSFVGDPNRLQQVVWNLLSNAVRFTPTGGRITVTLGRTDARIVLTVSDTGQGISADLLPHVFERFRQGRQAHGGLGLGLAIVRHLVELHGGTVEARSEGEGQGATFVVSLPLAGSPAPSAVAAS